MYKVFIVEDDKTISNILAQHLSKWGYEVKETVVFRITTAITGAGRSEVCQRCRLFLYRLLMII